MDKYERCEDHGSHEIISDNILVCADTGRVVAVFYNDYDLASVLDRTAELEKALNDLLNDCINFDGGKLTDVIMAEASRILK